MAPTINSETMKRVRPLAGLPGPGSNAPLVEVEMLVDMEGARAGTKLEMVQSVALELEARGRVKLLGGLTKDNETHRAALAARMHRAVEKPQADRSVAGKGKGKGKG